MFYCFSLSFILSLEECICNSYAFYPGMFHRSRIVFKTAGVLLDELQEKGMNALKYKAVILDEVHERSVESDLVLVSLKQFLMKNNDLRLTFSFFCFWWYF